MSSSNCARELVLESRPSVRCRQRRLGLHRLHLNIGTDMVQRNWCPWTACKYSCAAKLEFVRLRFSCVLRAVAYRVVFLLFSIPMLLLQDRVALVTGSGRGIGRAIAQLFAKEGASIFLTARTESELSGTAKEIDAANGAAGPDGQQVTAFATADLTKGADCERVFRVAREKFGRIDILVNNAGHYGPVVPVEEYALEEFDKVIAVHLRAAFLLSKLALPEMYARASGAILNIS